MDNTQNPQNLQRNSLRRNSIYLLPNSFTIAALFCAFFAITQSMHKHFEIARSQYSSPCCSTAWTGAWRG